MSFSLYCQDNLANLDKTGLWADHNNCAWKMVKGSIQWYAIGPSSQLIHLLHICVSLVTIQASLFTDYVTWPYPDNHYLFCVEMSAFPGSAGPKLPPPNIWQERCVLRTGDPACRGSRVYTAWLKINRKISLMQNRKCVLAYSIKLPFYAHHQPSVIRNLL